MGVMLGIAGILFVVGGLLAAVIVSPLFVGLTGLGLVLIGMATLIDLGAILVDKLVPDEEGASQTQQVSAPDLSPPTETLKPMTTGSSAVGERHQWISRGKPEPRRRRDGNLADARNFVADSCP